MTKPLLSVFCITYNHAQYISQAIDSFLIQNTSFPVEIIIGDDCSNDGTQEIIRDYQNRYPGRISLVTSSSNVGMKKNADRTREACVGKYLAICEGDDYWTDPHKLQRQVDYMESHPECAISFHNASVLDQQSNKIVGKLLNSKKKRYDTKDLLLENPIPTPTCVFRNYLFKSLPAWFSSTFPGDWPLHIINSLYGYADYLDKDMATYRSHPNSVTKYYGYSYKISQYIKMLDNIRNSSLPSDLKPYATKSIKKLCGDLATYYLYQEKRLDMFLFYYVRGRVFNK